MDFDAAGLVARIAQRLGRPAIEVERAVYDPELLIPFELGRITPQTYYQGLKTRLPLPWAYPEFVAAWNGILSERTDTIQLVQRLGRHVRLLALSNTNCLHIEQVRSRYASLAMLEHWVVSCEVGCRKPDPAIYELALRRAGVPASAAVYIDDLPELVQAGRQAGLTAIRFEGTDQLQAALRALGFTL